MRRLLPALMLPVLCGCSAFAPAKQSVAITANDLAAEIIVDGQKLGTGAITVDLERNKGHTIMARVGDRVGTSTIGTKISTTGTLDIVGGIFFLVPLIGLATPGFYELDATTVTVYVPGGAEPTAASADG